MFSHPSHVYSQPLASVWEELYLWCLILKEMVNFHAKITSDGIGPLTSVNGSINNEILDWSGLGEQTLKNVKNK